MEQMVSLCGSNEIYVQKKSVSKDAVKKQVGISGNSG